MPEQANFTVQADTTNGDADTYTVVGARLWAWVLEG